MIIVACPTYPEKFIWNNVIAPFLLLSVVIAFLPGRKLDVNATRCKLDLTDILTHNALLRITFWLISAYPPTFCSRWQWGDSDDILSATINAAMEVSCFAATSQTCVCLWVELYTSRNKWSAYNRGKNNGQVSAFIAQFLFTLSIRPTWRRVVSMTSMTSLHLMNTIFGYSVVDHSP